MRNTSLAFRFFFEEDAVIAYDEMSGDTHLLSIVAREIYEVLSVPASVAALKESLCSRFPEDASESVSEGVDIALAQLLGADLIQAVAD